MGKDMTKRQKKSLTRIIIAAVLMIILKFLPVEGWLKFVLYMVPYLVVGYDILRKAFKGILNKQVFDENFLMAVATIGAIALGNYKEGVSVMLFYQIGELFQSYAVGKSRRNISDLMDIRPDYANIEKDGDLEQVDPDEVEVGTVIVVQPGEKVPIDGVIEEGSSTLNTSALTGESVPREAAAGEEVISGCINLTGLLKIRTTKEFGESTVSKILDLVENASSRKSKSEDFISRFAKIYTPAVCYAALALAILPPLVRMFGMGLDADWETWIYRALTFLIISCPCALVISVPLSFFGGIGCASKNGVLVKGSNYLEALSHAQTVVMDKTGTLTEGKFHVTEQNPVGVTAEEQLELAALAESASNHPIAQSLKDAYGKAIDAERVTDIQEIAGHGVAARVDGRQVLAGNAAYLEDAGLQPETPHAIGTAVHLAVDGVYAGYILIADAVKPDAAQAVQAFRKAGVSTVAMLTGDSESAAKAVGDALQLDEVHAKCLPADKVKFMQEYRTKLSKGRTLVFVGDGMNDAPVLAQSDVGVAMGGLGSDAAIAAADLVILDDKPSKLGLAIHIAKKTMGIARQNIVFALGVKAIVLVLGALGLAHIGAAVFADVGVSVIAILNSTRAMRTKVK